MNETVELVPLHRRLVEWVDQGLADSDMTQRQLAEQAGISQKHLSQMLTGRSSGTLGLWDRLLAIVGVRDQALSVPTDHPEVIP